MKEYKVEFIQEELGFINNAEWYSEIVVAENEHEAKELMKEFLSNFEKTRYIFRVKECIYSDLWSFFGWDE
mgnify:CR=1 FL=1